MRLFEILIGKRITYSVITILIIYVAFCRATMAVTGLLKGHISYVNKDYLSFMRNSYNFISWIYEQKRFCQQKLFLLGKMQSLLACSPHLKKSL